MRFKKGQTSWNKGKHLSEEAKNKLRMINLGKHHSEETRKKLSELNKGENNPAYGKYVSEETRKKISLANKGYNLSEEAKRKISLANKGRKRSEEFKRQVSERGKLRMGEKNAFFGKHHSEETKEKLRLANLGKIPWQKRLGENNPKVIAYKQRVAKSSSETRRKYLEMGIAPWNKGLTKDTDIRVKKNAEHTHKSMKEKGSYKIIADKLKGRKNPWTTKRNLENNPMNNPEVKRKANETIKRLYKEGKIKAWNKGYGDYCSGEKSSNWRGGISFEPYSLEWTKKLKKLIRARDNYTCQLCSKKGIVVHHIDYNKKNCNPENLILLCVSCHGKTSFNRDKWKKFFQKL